MMKIASLLTVAVLAIHACPMAHADTENDKLIISYKPKGKKEKDCKISISEIKEVTQAGTQDVCIKVPAISPNDEEATPQGIATLLALAEAGKGKLVLGYTGKDEAKLAELFAAWEAYLEGQGNLIVDQDWILELVNKDETNTVYSYTNAQSGDSFEFTILMNYEKP
jgi:hypothetical protein